MVSLQSAALLKLWAVLVTAQQSNALSQQVKITVTVVATGNECYRS